MKPIMACAATLLAGILLAACAGNTETHGGQRENCASFSNQLETLYDGILDGVAETYGWNTEIKSGGRCQMTFHITMSACLNSSERCLNTHSECLAFEQSANAETDTRIHFTATPAGSYTCFVKIYATLET